MEMAQEEAVGSSGMRVEVDMAGEIWEEASWGHKGELGTQAEDLEVLTIGDR